MGWVQCGVGTVWGGYSVGLRHSVSHSAFRKVEPGKAVRWLEAV